MYLLFSPNDVLPLDQVVINTEAHPFPRFDLGQLFWTGWQRKPRGAKAETEKKVEEVKEEKKE
jgi:mannosyl-oligosaccharide alpha-1,2-mannosidase